MVLSQTTSEVVELLCRDVRVMAAHQIASRFFSGSRTPIRSANRLCRELERSGMAKKSRATVSLIDVSRPLLTWEPNEPDEPIQFESISYANSVRWTRGPQPRPTTVLTATSKAHGLFGGSSREVRNRELEHDLAVSALCLQIQQNPDHQWISEDSIDVAMFNGYRPDAIVKSDGGILVLDVLGRGYKPDKIQRTFNHFRDYPMQLR